MGQNPSFEQLVVDRSFTPEQVLQRTGALRERVLREAPNLREANFRVIGSQDLWTLLVAYDAVFFDDRLRCRFNGKGHPSLTLLASPRLTRAGGKTTCRRPRPPSDEPAAYSIAISSTLLFQTFDDVQREIIINGLTCRDRLEALQRIFEHELVHLLEMSIWGRSSCSGPRFQALARRIFAHTGVTHQLVTQRERAQKNFGIRVGDEVSFQLEGRRLQGVVNRITRRATVLVPSPDGALYRDGRRYQKFYVPLPLLEPRGGGR